MDTIYYRKIAALCPNINARRQRPITPEMKQLWPARPTTDAAMRTGAAGTERRTQTRASERATSSSSEGGGYDAGSAAHPDAHCRLCLRRRGTMGYRPVAL